MTTKWAIERIWEGQTVAVLGAGPDMTAELADTAKGYKTIAVNRAVKFAPWADMFVALDPHHPFWEEAENVGFTGMRVCGIDCDLDALYAGLFYERVTIAQGHNIEIRNNALAAIRIAYLMGAAKIILLGFDPERYEETHSHTSFYGLVQGLAQITAELTSKGLVIARVDSAEQFPGTRAKRRGELNEETKIDPRTFPQQKSKKGAK